MSSKKAFKVRIDSLKPHHNADKLQLASISGYQVVVGLDYMAGTSGVLFMPDAILTEEVVKKFELTYLSKGRVRVVKLRGEYSEALFIPMEEYDIAVLGGLDKMWEEYTPPVKVRTSAQVSMKSPTLNTVFPKHKDTQQYKANIGNIAALVDIGGRMTFSVKTHGTSGRTTKVRLPVKPNQWLWKLSNVLGDMGLWKLAAYIQHKLEDFVAGKFEKDYTVLTGTRNVILDDDVDNFRTHITEWFAHRLNNNEAVYYEILGWESPEQPIMQPYNNVPYSYGLPKGHLGIQVYRIVQDGVDLLPEAMENRSFDLGLVPVKRIEAATVTGAFTQSLRCTSAMMATGEGAVDILDYTHTNEGLVIRVDVPNVNKPYLFKLKGNEFLIQEGILPQQGDM